MGRFLLGVIVTLIALAGGAYAVITGGRYDLAATTPDNALVAWAAQTTRQAAITRAATGIVPPSPFTEAQLRQGRRIYGETCVYCHGAPGADPEAWSGGMNPKPPYMPDIAGMMSEGHVFWVIRHGIRMTGMPSFAKALNEADSWAVVAFVKRLEGMTPEQYRALAP